MAGREIPPELEAEVDATCDRFEAAWLADEQPALEDFLAGASAAAHPYLLPELVALEWYYRRTEQEELLSAEELLQAHPALASQLDAILANIEDPHRTASRTDDPASASGDVATASSPSDVQLAELGGSRGLHVRCPHCSNAMELLADTPYEDVTCRTCGSTFNLVEHEGPTQTASTLRRIGRFELVARLGVGGFGTVWKARDTELDRLVALKIPRKGQLSPQETEHFFREARAAAQLRHPHIVAVYEVGRDDDTVFIVSDFVRGVSLADWLTGDPPGFGEIARMCATIADALHHAHEQGVVHRDLKPSNIMINEEGAPLIMDFGLAKRDAGEVTMTVEGQILGTPGYMSPEQARGQSHWTDRRSDIYSLGTMVFRMTTGELPFRGNMRMQLHNKLTNDPPDPRRLNHAIPRDLATICFKCIQRDPNHRYDTAKQVADEMGRFARGEPIHARPLSRLTRVWRWARRNPAGATACSLATVLAVGGPLVAWQQGRLRGRAVALNQDLQDKNDGYERLIRQHVADRDKLELVNHQLTTQLDVLTQAPGNAPSRNTGWRQQVMQKLLDARESEMQQQLQDSKSDPADAVRAGLGLGMLLVHLNYDERAIKVLEHTGRRLQTWQALDPDLPTTDSRFGDAWHQLGRLHQDANNPVAAQEALHTALRLRTSMADRPMADCFDQLRLLESTLNATEVDTTTPARLTTMLRLKSLVERVDRQWPELTADFYQLSCWLTGNPPCNPPQ